ncbi:hypothetical protein [Occultella kanbiaonis]|uniref:hypothetical protein n=1 Tax=Occultella kanbiaonis TaxID=2675754 RepID=UPI0013D36DF1|nr:hypothetical protein [Occultella kanbiaonis]
MRTFIAKYKSPCVVCEEPIEPGDSATYDEDDYAVHASCRMGDPYPEKVRRVPTICGACFLTVCDCTADDLAARGDNP